MTTANNRFKKGSAIYTCMCCGKRTRATGHSEENNGLCADCYNCGGDENAVADGAMTQAEFDKIWPVGHRSRNDTPKVAPAAPAVDYSKDKWGVKARLAEMQAPAVNAEALDADLLADTVRNLLNAKNIEAAVDGLSSGCITIRLTKENALLLLSALGR